MAAKAIEHEMYTYFMQLNDEEKKSVVKMIKTFIKGKGAENKRVTIEQYNKELEEAERRVEAGDFITQEELEEEMKNW
jgi:hypothetical protein